MEEKDDHEFFAELLDRVLDARIVGAWLVPCGDATEASVRWSGGAPSVAVCWSASASLVLGGDAQGRRTSWEKGEALVMAPQCELALEPAAAFEALRLCFESDATVFEFHHKGEHPQENAATAELSSAASDELALRVYAAPCGLDLVGREMLRLSLMPASAPHQRHLPCLLEALLHKARAALHGHDPQPAEGRGRAHQRWRGVCRFIEEHCDEPLSRQSVARAFKLHPSYLSQLFATHGDESFGAFLLRVRLERACLLLQSPELNVAEIARLSGFADPNYFVRAFKKRYDTTPGRARAAHEAQKPSD